MELGTATLLELETIVHWATAEGWNPGIEDAAVFFDTDPEGFFVARKDGALAAGISVVNHSPKFAFLGLYICRQDLRGQGLGFELWRHALAHAGTRTIGLDGVPDQQANYKKSGFDPGGQTHRYMGKIPPKSDDSLRPMTLKDYPAVAAMDTDANGYARNAFLEAWTTETATRRSLVMEQDGIVCGFVTARRCQRGVKIGPLVAGSDNHAKTLLHGAATLFPDNSAMIDIPDTVTGLSAHCKSLKMKVHFVTARMYRGKAPKQGPLLQAVATLELG